MEFKVHIVEANVPCLISLKELEKNQLSINFRNLRLLTKEGNIIQLIKVPSGHLSFPKEENNQKTIYVTQLDEGTEITVENITSV